MISKQSTRVLCADLGESFQTHIYLQNLASVQPRTSPSKLESWIVELEPTQVFGQIEEPKAPHCLIHDELHKNEASLDPITYAEWIHFRHFLQSIFVHSDDILLGIGQAILALSEFPSTTPRENNSIAYLEVSDVFHKEKRHLVLTIFEFYAQLSGAAPPVPDAPEIKVLDEADLCALLLHAGLFGDLFAPPDLRRVTNKE